MGNMYFSCFLPLDEIETVDWETGGNWGQGARNEYMGWRAGCVSCAVVSAHH